MGVNMKSIILISKDALNKHSLPIYGNKFWDTPNIDALAAQGTVFNRHYTSAGSTAMAFTSMALGDYCYKTGRKTYKNEKSINGNTLFDKLYNEGYDCHIVWDSTYTEFAQSHFKCEGIHTKIHSLANIKQGNSKHIKGQFDDMTFDDIATEHALDKIYNELRLIKECAKRNYFIWMHLPHVMCGRQGYGSDIDVYDKIIGLARELFGDDNIFISADHGHMNGCKGKYHYGFDVEEEAICIPLITPKINNSLEINFPTSSIQMYEILFKRTVQPLEYILCETAYYAQPKRKISIIKGKYKYIFDKERKKEFLYDLDFDPEENHNLVYPEFYDVDRYLWYSTSQCFYYPYWKESIKILGEFRIIKSSIWENAPFIEEMINKILHRVKCLYTKIKLLYPSDNIVNNGK